MSGEPQSDELQDPIPDPEPAVPSLAKPDPAVYHHDIAPTPATNESA